MNGLSGLVSFVPTKGSLFSVEGGNYRLVESGLNQARATRRQKCIDRSEHEQQVRHIAREVTAVIGDLDTGMELFSGEESQGCYDLVILAAPLQHCNIDFLITSHLDGAVLQPMHLGAIKEEEGEGEEDKNMREHISSVLPSSAERSYMQVVTTVLSNATLWRTYLPSHTLHPMEFSRYSVKRSSRIVMSFECLDRVRTLNVSRYGVDEMVERHLTLTEVVMLRLRRLFCFMMEES